MPALFYFSGMEAKEFTASRLSGDNKVLPNTYKINDFGVTLIYPGVFKDKQVL